MGRTGYIDYYDTNQFTSELGELLVRIEDDGEDIGALKQAFVLLEEAMGAFQYADDSGGDIGFLVEDTLATIESIAIDIVQIQPDQHQAFFDKILLKSEHPMIEEWVEYQIRLLKICVELANNSEQSELVRRKVTSMIDETS